MLCMGYVFLTLIKMDIQIDQLINAVPIYLFIIVILFFVVERHFNSLIWNVILQQLGNKKIDKRDTTEVCLRSNIGKYLPGNVMQYAGRNLIGKKYKLHQGDMALATILEIGTMLTGAIVLLIAVGFRANMDLVQSLIADKAMLYISVIGIIVIGAGIAAIKMKKQLHEYLTKILNLKFIVMFIGIVFIRIVMMFGAGMTFANIVQAMITSADWLHIVKVYCFAWVLGFVVPGAPGGLGVRETVLMVSLTSLPQESLMVAMIWHRVATILSDITCFGLSFAWKRKD